MERVRKLLLAKGYDAAAIKAMEKSVKKEVDTAVEESKVRAAIMRRAAATMRCCDSKYCPAVLGGCYAHGVAASIGTPAAFMQAVTHRGLVTLVLPTCAQRDVQACLHAMLCATLHLVPHSDHAALACVQAAATPPNEWLWRNVYVAPANMDMRTVEGTYVQPTYDPTYSS